MSSVRDFTEAEQWAVETTSRERWPEQAPAIQHADVEIRMHPQDGALTAGPAASPEHSKTSFVIMKAADRTYRSPFCYRGFQQYGTGKNYDDITGCAAPMLQAHADKEARDREQSA